MRKERDFEISMENDTHMVSTCAARAKLSWGKLVGITPWPGYDIFVIALGP